MDFSGNPHLLSVTDVDAVMRLADGLSLKVEKGRTTVSDADLWRLDASGSHDFHIIDEHAYRLDQNVIVITVLTRVTRSEIGMKSLDSWDMSTRHCRHSCRIQVSPRPHLSESICLEAVGSFS